MFLLLFQPVNIPVSQRMYKLINNITTLIDNEM